MKHLQSVNETYFEHLKFAIANSMLLFRAGLTLLIHGIFPFVLITKTMDLILKLSEKFYKRNPIKSNPIKSKIPSYCLLDYIGNTPLILINSFINNQPNVKLYAKCEFFNPTLSIKDRMVLSMLRHYEQHGSLKPGATIYEASSGNTGSSLAMIGRKLGYRVVITVPKKTSQEKINTMLLFGAEVIISKSEAQPDSSEHYVNKAKILSKADSNGFYFNQYENEENVMTHYRTTAREIWEKTNFKIDYVICCASSGATITGIGRYLKEKNSKIKVILADPVGSVFYDYFHGNILQAKPYRIEGAGKDKVCSIHDFSIIDEVIQFTDEEAYQALNKLALTEGLLAGGSSGGALAVSEKLIKTLPKEKNLAIVIVLPDSGFKYLSKIGLNVI